MATYRKIQGLDRWPRVSLDGLQDTVTACRLQGVPGHLWQWQQKQKANTRHDVYKPWLKRPRTEKGDRPLDRFWHCHIASKSVPSVACHFEGALKGIHLAEPSHSPPPAKNGCPLHAWPHCPDLTLRDLMVLFTRRHVAKRIAPSGGIRLLLEWEKLHIQAVCQRHAAWDVLQNQVRWHT